MPIGEPKKVFPMVGIPYDIHIEGNLALYHQNHIHQEKWSGPRADFGLTHDDLKRLEGT